MNHSDKAAFSLVELLVVMAVLGLLSVTAIPAINSIGASRGVEQGLYEVSGLLELARAEAVARQSYVWVGFENTTVNGRSVLRMAAACAQDGGTNSSNLLSLTRTLQIRDAVLVGWPDLKSETRALFTQGSPVSVALNNSSVSLTGSGGVPLTKSITFTPCGEAMLTGTPTSSTPYDACIDLSFRQTKGTQVLANADDAAVIVDGSTGTIQRVRLQ